MGRLPLVLATLGLACGIVLGLQRPVPEWGGPLLVPTALGGGLLAVWLLLRLPAGVSAPARLPLLLIAAGGALLGAAERRGSDGSCIRWIPDGATVQVSAVVRSVQADRLVLGVDSLRIERRALACEIDIPARAKGGPPVAAGRRVVATGRWWTPPGPPPTLGRAGALLVDSLVERRRGDRVPREPGVERLRRAARSRVDALFEDRAPLAASLLLAQRDGLDRDVRERFARAGLSHLLAISGLHVGLVAGILLLLASLLRVGRRTGAILAALGTLAYVAFLGAPHSAVRAALQIVLLLGARMLQRPTRSAALIAAAAFAILLAQPGAILGPGFQLSFAGVVGILALRRPLLTGLEPLARLRAGRFRGGRWLADGIATSLAATLATAPIAAWHFGRLAPVGVVANLAAIPLLGLAVPALALPLALDPLVPAAAAFLAPPAVLLLDLLDRLATVAAGVPGGTATTSGPSALLATAAVGVGWAVARRAGRVRRGVRVSLWAGVALAVVLVAPLRPGSDLLELHMIDVGQGDAFALRTPAGRWILVDAGLGGRDWDAGERRVVPYLARRGVRRLEGLVLTHPDADHVGGAAAVLRALRPRWIGDPGVAAGKDLYLSLLEAAAGGSVAWVGLEQATALELDGVAIEILYPETVAMDVEDANDASVVARIEYGDFAALLTGDAPAAVERKLVERYGAALEADVLKVGHHGSVTSTTPELLAATGARLALVSAGRGNRYGHPHAVVLRRMLDRGVQVLRSDQDGSVVLRTDGRGEIRVETERGGGR